MRSTQRTYDILIIGAGIVGLSTAYHLSKLAPQLRIAVLEKEDHIAGHQTGHNSGVIHSGIYYKPGSAKALNCLDGYKRLLKFIGENGIQYDLCGKIIVATEENELDRLDNIYKRGIENGLTGIRKIDAAECKKIEPHVRALAGIHVPEAGIIDYKEVAEAYATFIGEKDNDIRLKSQVIGIKEEDGELKISTHKRIFKTRMLINCAGLYSDKIATMTGLPVDHKILPFRGEYYQLKKEKEHLVNGLIYPVPNPKFPFLGVHFTKMVHGGVEAGPNAVLAFRREGYERWDISATELEEIFSYKGFRSLAKEHWKYGWSEMLKSFSKKYFVKALQKLIPEIQEKDVYKAGSGVRAQAVGPNGELLDDFLILENEKVINVCNAPSPAATASLAIGAQICEKALNKLSAYV